MAPVSRIQLKNEVCECEDKQNERTDILEEEGGSREDVDLMLKFRAVTTIEVSLGRSKAMSCWYCNLVKSTLSSLGPSRSELIERVA